MPDTFKKHPDAVLDYVFDWRSFTNRGRGSDWLESGETISTKVVTPDTGITLDSNALTDSNTSITIWVSSGVAGRNYKVKAAIVTSAGRKDTKTMTFRVK